MGDTALMGILLQQGVEAPFLPWFFGVIGAVGAEFRWSLNCGPVSCENAATATLDQANGRWLYFWCHSLSLSCILTGRKYNF